MNIHITNYINKLTKIKRNRFRKFISSDYFNSNRRVLSLLDTLVSGNYNEQLLHKKIYPEYKFKRQRIYDLCSELSLLFQKFIAIENLDDVKNWDVEILSGLRKEGLEKMFLSKYKGADKKLDKLKIRNDAYYYRKFQYSNLHDEFIAQTEKQSSDYTLQEKSDYFDIYYLSVKLKLICEMLNREQIISSSFELRAIDQILEIISLNTDYYFNYPPIHFYYHLTKLSQNGSIEAYKRLVELLGVYKDVFTLEENREFYEYLQNHCIRQINKGDQIFLSHLFHLFEERFNNDLFKNLENIPELTYKTAVTVGLRLSKYDWVFRIISEYKDLLSKQIRENAYNYNLANLYFEKTEYRKALRILNTIEFTNVFYNLDARVVVLKFTTRMKTSMLLEQQHKPSKPT